MARVTLNDDPASVPDLMSLELLIQKAMGDLKVVLAAQI